ncbi:uncharacterized protein IL334_001282 [Kwoniella shivajii]|uniref:Uncharacterized protein n=1 Tax=Kwoniella shivajii TaxID=564305 RepID=A0ABZ1CRU8_9TREE|nr:hypothetical protein IL334_001282 [Kwoniella shivajii]
MEIAMILGMVFDLSIPLQYHNDEHLASKHSTHLENYWPTFIIGCLIEGVSFFLLHPDLFTLIVCVKTVFLFVTWLSKDQDGLRIQPGDARSSRSNSNRHSKRSSPNDPNDPSRPSRSSSSSGGPPKNMPECKSVPSAYKHLKKAGYSDQAIAGMILSMNQNGDKDKDKDRSKKNFDTWRKEKDPKELQRRNQQYSDFAKKSGWNPSSSSSSLSNETTQGSGGDGGESSMPQSKYIESPYKHLKKAGYDDAAIAGMILSVNKSGDKDHAKKVFDTWRKERDPKEIKRRNGQYTAMAQKAGWKSGSGSSGGGGSSSASDGPSNMPTSKFIPNPYKQLKKAGYEDQAIAGMIISMNQSGKDHAEKVIKIWSSEKDPKQIKRRNQQYIDSAKKSGWPDKSKMDSASQPSSSGSNGRGGGGRKKLAISVKAVKQIESRMKQLNGTNEQIDQGIQSQILSILKNPQSENDLEKVTNTLKQFGIKVDLNSPEFVEGYGELDPNGNIRDIVLREETVSGLCTGMVHKAFEPNLVQEWLKYLTVPRSKREFNDNIVPLAKRVDVYLGDGYTGTGPNQINRKALESIKPDIQKKTGAPSSMVDHMIEKAINMLNVEESEKMLKNWAMNGIGKSEFEQFRREMGEWA